MIVGVFEFIGVYFFGKSVMEMIRKGIFYLDRIIDLMVFIYGLVVVLFVVMIWLVIVIKFGLFVLIIYLIIGGIVGYGIVYVGFLIVNWGKMI